MATITVADGTEIFYKDTGSGQPIVFSHGWPLSSDDWDDQIFFFASRGYRCIAHDRRGHGRSSQPWHGNDLDTYADDLAELVAHLDLRDAVHVGHSTGGKTDTTEDLKKFDIPTLFLHGDDDQIVPIGAAALLASKIVKGTKLKVYKGAPHGMCTTLKDQVNEDLLAFIKG